MSSPVRIEQLLVTGDRPERCRVGRELGRRFGRCPDHLICAKDTKSAPPRRWEAGRGRAGCRQTLNQCRASRINLCGPPTAGYRPGPEVQRPAGHGPRHAWRAVISAPLFVSASTTSTPRDIPLTIRLRRGKLSFSGGVPSGYSLSTARAEFDLLEQRRIFRRVGDVDAAPQHRDRPPVRGATSRPAVGGGVDSACSSADHRNSRAAQQRPGIVRPARGRNSCTAGCRRSRRRSDRGPQGFLSRTAPPGDRGSIGAGWDTS